MGQGREAEMVLMEAEGLVSSPLRPNVRRFPSKAPCVGDSGVCCPLTFYRSRVEFSRLLAALREPWFIALGFCPAHLQSKVLKLPFSGSKAWFSMRASPKPMASTARVRMKRRVTPKTAAQALNLFVEAEKGCELLGSMRKPSPTFPKVTLSRRRFKDS